METARRTLTPVLSSEEGAWKHDGYLSVSNRASLLEHSLVHIEHPLSKFVAEPLVFQLQGTRVNSPV